MQLINTSFQSGTAHGRQTKVAVLALFGNSLFAVLAAVYCIDFLVVVYCTGMDTVMKLVQSLVIFSGEQESASP